MITSAEEFRRLRLSQDPDEYARAAREEAPEAVWLDVIAHFPEMRRWVAHNKTVPLSILRILAKDDDRGVRTTVAMKRKLDGDLFLALSRDEDAGVRHALAYNAKCPPEVLRLLAEDKEAFVAEASAQRLEA